MQWHISELAKSSFLEQAPVVAPSCTLTKVSAFSRPLPHLPS